MRYFLDNFIDTLSTRQSTRISLVLEDAKVSKEQLDRIAAQLADELSRFVPLVLSFESEEGDISSTRFELNFRDAFIRLKELFAVSNLISLLLESHGAVLSSEIKAIEDELVSLDKLAQNYAFLLADNGAYDYACLEPFSDERKRDYFDFEIPDRTSQTFGPAEQASVRSDEGVLVLPKELGNTHTITGSILKTNVAAFTTNSTDIDNATIARSVTGWRLNVASVGPVRNPLAEAEGILGAQALVEFMLSQPAPASEIKIVPFAEQAVELVQIYIYKTEKDENGIPLLAEPFLLNRSFTFHFPLQTVAKFRVVLNQPTYNRITTTKNLGEEEYARLSREMKDRRNLSRKERRLLWKSAFRPGDARQISRVHQIIRILRLDDKQWNNIFVARPEVDFNPEFGPLRLDRVIQAHQTEFGSHELWEMGDPYELFLTKIFKENIDIFRELFPKDVAEYEKFTLSRDADYMRTQGAVISGAATSAISPEQTGYYYEYRLGLQFIGIGVEAPGFKGVFVSTPFDSAGDIGEVRLKTSEENYRLAATSRDSGLLTSVEYSVSNRSSPRAESSWLPILPVNTTIVEGERLFLDAGGTGFFRFSADRLKTISCFRNGYLVVVNQGYFLTSQNSAGVIGIKFPVGSYSSEDIFTVNYWPLGDHTVTNFEGRGFSDLPLTTAYDSTGAGESFPSSGGQYVIDLSHAPYIDYNAINIDTTYSETFGIIGYSPITVQISGQNNPINLTNYLGGTSTELSPVASSYQFLQSGRSLRFNKVITAPLRVFYQYLQNNVRVRVVLRVNDKNFVSPKVDFYHLKAKTRRSDARGA